MLQRNFRRTSNTDCLLIRVRYRHNRRRRRFPAVPCRAARKPRSRLPVFLFRRRTRFEKSWFGFFR